MVENESAVKSAQGLHMSVPTQTLKSLMAQPLESQIDKSPGGHELVLD
jgi:hypothetical protein